MSDDVLAYRVEQAEKAIAELHAEIEQLESEQRKASKQFETELQAAKDLQAKRDRQNLVWGIGVLGAVVTTLGGVIWQYRSFIFRD